MSRRRLTNSVSVDELLKMREGGMTNSDIASVLDVSIQTVRRYIGNQPGRAPRYTYTPKPMKSHCESLGWGSGVSESAPACLTVTRREINLKGVYGKYKIASDGSSVTLDLTEAEECIDMPVDKLPSLINELTAIMRHIPELSKGNEMW